MRTDKKPWRNRKGEEGISSSIAIGEPRSGGGHPLAAGIDVGNGAHYVAVRPDRDPQPVRRFECFTADLHRLAAWLQSCGVKTVALQSTIDRCVLDSPVRHFGRTRVRGLSG